MYHKIQLFRFSLSFNILSRQFKSMKQIRRFESIKQIRRFESIKQITRFERFESIKLGKKHLIESKLTK